MTCPNDKAVLGHRHCGTLGECPQPEQRRRGCHRADVAHWASLQTLPSVQPRVSSLFARASNSLRENQEIDKGPFPINKRCESPSCDALRIQVSLDMQSGRRWSAHAQSHNSWKPHADTLASLCFRRCKDARQKHVAPQGLPPTVDPFRLVHSAFTGRLVAAWMLAWRCHGSARSQMRLKPSCPDNGMALVGSGIDDRVLSGGEGWLALFVMDDGVLSDLLESKMDQAQRERLDRRVFEKDSKSEIILVLDIKRHRGESDVVKKLAERR
ncbi:uncharacterized protein K452DRAFT_46371 [Aplosporella prunicola CBS 121167]|uniref:Uncharacterized protein n=1 Tax=Aplosporella prunicola CBS 121167 TaxID=1176127 RepID=A0A6A6AWA5_9PEZI|nr:uncharacterized protein K452DRAFT_46371 [Aplosporella prunicola CBS 121167]KAF2135224.1 hypothetical protein K452DRAFT_46371 [Aplosporella prunicola CBS 121167]